MISWGPRVRFYQQLGSLLQSGLGLTTALPLAGNAAGGSYRPRARSWADACGRGQELSSLLDGEPPTARALVRAGERTGRLPEVCARIADLTEQARQVRRTLIHRSLYPLTLVHAALVFPAVPAVVLGQAGAGRLLIGPGLFWLVVGLLVLAWRVGLDRGWIGRAAVVWPLRPLVLPLLADRICLVAAAAHGAGLLHRPALELAAEACGNQRLGQRLTAAARDLEAHRVAGLAPALGQAGIDPTTVALVAAGEAGGRLTESLGQAALHNRQTFTNRLDATLRIGLGVLMALAMLLAAATVISMWTGVYQQALHEVEANE